MSSGAIKPARAPASIDMLQIVMRPSIDRARIASPAYSRTCPAAPSTPIRPIVPRMTSFGVTPEREVAAVEDPHRLRPQPREALRRQHVLDLRRPDPERERSERAVRRRVAVAAHDRRARLREAELRADDVHDPLAPAARRVERDAELGAVRPQRLELRARERVAHRTVVCRDVVIHRREGQVRSPDGAPCKPEPLEGLRRGHLVDQVQVDVEEGGLAVGLVHDVRVPDPVEERPRHGRTVLDG